MRRELPKRQAEGARGQEKTRVRHEIQNKAGG